MTVFRLARVREFFPHTGGPYNARPKKGAPVSSKGGAIPVSPPPPVLNKVTIPKIYVALINALLIKQTPPEEINSVNQYIALTQKLSPEQQERNLRVAHKLIDKHASSTAVSAALLLGIDPKLVEQKSVREILEARDYLANTPPVNFNWQEKNQVDYLRSLFFRLAPNHEVLLIVSLEDLIDLRILGSDFKISKPSHLRLAYRGDKITSWVLKHLSHEYEEEAGELASLALMHLKPEVCAATEKKFAADSAGMDEYQRTQVLQRIAMGLAAALSNQSLDNKIEFRLKKVASGAQRDATRPNDCNGLRVILKSEEAGNCYLALSFVREYLRTRGWVEDSDFYKDYILMTKPNGYRSLHTCFVRKDEHGRIFRIEVQFRTTKMDWVANFGSASHADYKDGNYLATTTPKDKVSMGPEDRFMYKAGLLRQAGAYFVWDTKGTLHKLVAGQGEAPTVLDFAFKQGIEIGLKANGGEINGHWVPLKTQLACGQVVSAMTTEATSARTAYANRKQDAHTHFARAILTAVTSGTVIETRGNGETELEAIGRDIFSKLVSDFCSEMEGKYGLGKKDFNLHYSAKRIYEKLGFAEEKELFITLAIMGEASEVGTKIKTYLKSNSVFEHHRIIGGLAILKLYVANRPGVLYKLCQTLSDFPLGLAAFVSKEFNFAASVSGDPIRTLCDQIARDKLAAGHLAPAGTIDWLNESLDLINPSELLNKIGKNNIPEDWKKELEILQKMHYDDQNRPALRRLNRLLLELAYPKLCPTSEKLVALKQTVNEATPVGQQAAADNGVGTNGENSFCQVELVVTSDSSFGIKDFVKTLDDLYSQIPERAPFISPHFNISISSRSLEKMAALLDTLFKLNVNILSCLPNGNRLELTIQPPNGNKALEKLTENLQRINDEQGLKMQIPVELVTKRRRK